MSVLNLQVIRTLHGLTVTLAINQVQGSVWETVVKDNLLFQYINIIY